MPYDIAKGFDGCPYAVVKLTPDGRELAPGGCHQTAIEAGKHLAALQAATDYERGELRHPGHGDQSVHNPNKGASIVPAGFVRPTAAPEFADSYTAKNAAKRYPTDESYVQKAHAEGLTPTLDVDKPKASEVLTKDELRAVELYQTDTTKMQDWAIGRKVSPGEAREAELLVGVMNRNELDMDTTLHRGIGGVFSTQMQETLDSAGVGGVVTTGKFLSTSVDSGVAAGFGSHDLVINAPAGTKGVFVSRVINLNKGSDIHSTIAKDYGVPFGGEAEFAMPPGVKLRIDSIVPAGPNPGSRNKYEVTIIP